VNSDSQSKSIITKLSIMMFLQFFIWGAWYTSVSLFMSNQGMEKDIYWVYTAGPLAAIISPFFIGFVADRFINTEKVLAGLFILGSVSMITLPQLAGPGKSSVVNTCIFLHMLCYMPTLALSASISFKHLSNGVKQFPIVRVWGTIGWIAAGLLISFLDAEKTSTQFYLAGGASLILGFFCFSLPKTPAPLKGLPTKFKDIIFWDAWSLMKKPSFAVFIISSFLICIPLAAYYAYLQNQMSAMGIDNVAAAKTLGQGSEILFMLLMPFLFRKLGVKKMIAIGVFAWALRYALFALGASESLTLMIYAGIFLHGICYDFFFVTGQIYVDQASPKDIQGQAQSLNVFWTQGVGLFVGAIVCGKFYNSAFGDKSGVDPANLQNWSSFWWPLAAMAGVILIIFLIAFKHKDDADSEFTH
jgi:nucleoside transporter